jgi:4-diphosphocytidyl-2C-methyl-D-erythritol kinase
VSLSGSGSSIFAIFEKEETRQATMKALSNSNWRMFAVATVTRSEYRDALSMCQGLFPISF